MGTEPPACFIIKESSMKSCKDCKYCEPPISAKFGMHCSEPGKECDGHDFRPCANGPYLKENEMNKELQERLTLLKDDIQAKAFALRSEDEQAVLMRAGFNNCLFLSDTADWVEARKGNGHFKQHLTYILKPGYKPEPEYEDFPIIADSQRNLRCNGVWIDCIAKSQDFVEFFYDNGPAVTVGHISLIDVATSIRNGKKVVARFVKG